jgi:hypothetical protein
MNRTLRESTLPCIPRGIPCGMMPGHALLSYHCTVVDHEARHRAGPRAGDGILSTTHPRRGRWSGAPPFFQSDRAVPPLRIRIVLEKICENPADLGGARWRREEGCVGFVVDGTTGGVPSGG